MTKNNHKLGQFELSGIAPAPRGQPQIEVTFAIDKGRLTQEEIDRMIADAEKFADEDRQVKERVDAKNAFEGYLNSMKTATEEKGMSEKLDDDEKEQIAKALKDGQEWLSSNPEADAAEIKEKQKEVEGVCAPIVSKHMGGAAGGASQGDDDEDDDAHDEL